MKDTLIFWILGVSGAVALLGTAAGFLIYRRYARLALIRLVGHRESIRAAYRALESTFASLAEETPAEMLAFAQDPENVRRKALEELRERVGLEIDELADIALPKSAWHGADLLLEAAQRVSDEIGRITEAGDPEGVLGAVAALDVEAMRTALAAAATELDALLSAAKLKDASFYSGGLYI